MMLNTEEKNILREIARNSIESAVLKKIKYQPPEKWRKEIFTNEAASFVTLRIKEDLRGCMGTVQPARDLLTDIMENAVSSAIRDPRFSPVEPEELKRISMEISILHDFKNIKNNGRKELLETILPGSDGLILEENSRRATFLPSVWDSLPDPEMFLSRLLMKAGLPMSYWSNRIKITIYRTESF